MLPDQERIELRVPTSSLKRWRATAAVENLTLSDWIRQRCDEVAVDQELIDDVEKKLKERNERLARHYGGSSGLGPFPASADAIIDGKPSVVEKALHSRKRAEAIVASNKPAKKDAKR
jgi:hypothetical protein